MGLGEGGRKAAEGEGRHLSSFCGEACAPSSSKNLILQTASARSCSGFLGSPIDAKAILGWGDGGGTGTMKVIRGRVRLQMWGPYPSLLPAFRGGVRRP